MTEPVIPTDRPVDIVTRIEGELRPFLTPLQSRVVALRVLVARLGEIDAWGRWSSRIWTQTVLFQPIFPSTWQRERVLLAIAAASAAERADRLRAKECSLFNLAFSFDATLSRSLKLLSVEVYARIGSIIDAVQWDRVQNLSTLEELGEIKDENNSVASDSIAQITKSLASSARDLVCDDGARL